ncbi:hypothetical protein Btus_0495 [Kyrpidia tusciae DSM 2912]|uniref:Uncharacterized protein n=1 Tax=Kyrpidia tusciae (strain DSM 2912 / NBRC 15312 / T2) TaxID=562970 RepID=D5WTU3_KYRT2|nr:hypothetical protein Btus_0495 [Kyrpidia tusciae DSM 2912]
MSLFPRTFSTNPIGVASLVCPLSGLSSTGWMVQAMLNQGQVLGYLAQELHLLRSRSV